MSPESRVVRVLEDRWKEVLPEGRVTKRMLKRLRARTHFKQMVERVREFGCITLPSIDHHPLVSRNPDGTYRSLMLDELGEDPTLYVCTDCGDEIAAPKQNGRCEPCAVWRKTGVLTK